MADSPIQFPQGMSLPEFMQAFGSESACFEAVLCARWPGGFSCPHCGGTALASFSASADRCFSAMPVIARPR